MTTSAKVQFAGKRSIVGERRSSLREVLEGLLFDHSRVGMVSVVFVDDTEIRRVHREFFGDDTPTDVVTFPTTDDKPTSFGDTVPRELLADGHLGEVLVSVDTARRQASSRGLALERELALYSIHGVLHILGYDDKDTAGRQQMRRLERRYLGRLSF